MQFPNFMIENMILLVVIFLGKQGAGLTIAFIFGHLFQVLIEVVEIEVLHEDHDLRPLLAVHAPLLRIHVIFDYESYVALELSLVCLGHIIRCPTQKLHQLV